MPKGKLGNRLLPENCNKAKCEACPFGGRNPIDLRPERLSEIFKYTQSLQNTHICHITDKTCYGALEVQAPVLHKLGIIEKPTVESLIEAAVQTLNLKTRKNGR